MSAITEENVLRSECLDDDQETEWMERIAAILDEPGSTAVEAAEVVPGSIWLGAKQNAEEAFHSNRQQYTHVLNCCEPWCPIGPAEDTFFPEDPQGRSLQDIPPEERRYYGIEAYDNGALATHLVLVMGGATCVCGLHPRNRAAQWIAQTLLYSTLLVPPPLPLRQGLMGRQRTTARP